MNTGVVLSNYNDEQESMIDRYLERGEMFVMFSTESDSPIGVAVVTDEGNGVCGVQTTSFYRSCGFHYSHTIPNFFTDHYDHPIIEEGKLLQDMIYFQKELTD